MQFRVQEACSGTACSAVPDPSRHFRPRRQADENLAMFMDYCTYGHMIDNVVLIVTGTLHERDVQVRRNSQGMDGGGGAMEGGCGYTNVFRDMRLL